MEELSWESARGTLAKNTGKLLEEFSEEILEIKSPEEISKSCSGELPEDLLEEFSEVLF